MVVKPEWPASRPDSTNKHTMATENNEDNGHKLHGYNDCLVFVHFDAIITGSVPTTYVHSSGVRHALWGAPSSNTLILMGGEGGASVLMHIAGV